MARDLITRKLKLGAPLKAEPDPGYSALPALAPNVMPPKTFDLGMDTRQASIPSAGIDLAGNQQDFADYATPGQPAVAKNLQNTGELLVDSLRTRQQGKFSQGFDMGQQLFASVVAPLMGMSGRPGAAEGAIQSVQDIQQQIAARQANRSEQMKQITGGLDSIQRFLNTVDPTTNAYQRELLKQNATNDRAAANNTVRIATANKLNEFKQHDAVLKQDKQQFDQEIAQKDLELKQLREKNDQANFERVSAQKDQLIKLRDKAIQLGYAVANNTERWRGIQGEYYDKLTGMQAEQLTRQLNNDQFTQAMQLYQAEKDALLKQSETGKDIFGNPVFKYQAATVNEKGQTVPSGQPVSLPSLPLNSAEQAALEKKKQEYLRSKTKR